MTPETPERRAIGRPPETLAEIAARLHRNYRRSATSRQSLLRHFALLRYTEAELRERFTPAEWELMRSALRPLVGYEGIPPVAAAVADALRVHGAPDTLDTTELLQKLDALTPTEKLALLDMVERAKGDGSCAGPMQ